MTKDTSRELKGAAILLMIWLHLFSSEAVIQQYTPLLYFWNGDPLPYVLRKVCSMCVPIYAFIGGYGLAKTNLPHLSGGRHKRLNAIRALTLYANFWIVFVLFFPLGAALNPDVFLAPAQEIVCNFLALSVTMNGAWWFLLPYAVLTLLSGYITKWMYGLAPGKEAAALAAAFALNVLAYVGEKTTVSDIRLVQLLYENVARVGLIAFMFMAGISFAKHGWADKIYGTLRKQRRPDTILALTAAALIIIKMCIGATSLINPWFVFVLVPCYAMAARGPRVRGFFAFFGRHNTNMWLTHFFFIHYIFSGTAYALRYPVLIFAAVVAATLASSYVVDLLNKPVRRAIGRLRG